MAEIEDRYYSMPEIMKYLGISRDTALRWIATKEMPAHKVGKKWKFKVSEIDEWVNSGKAEEHGRRCQIYLLCGQSVGRKGEYNG